MSDGDNENGLITRLIAAAIEVVNAPIAVCSDLFAELKENDDRLRTSESFGQSVLNFATLPWRVMVGIVTFVLFSWSSSRSFWAFVLGAPAVLGMGGYFGAVFAADMIRGETQMIQTNLAYYQHNTVNSPDNPEWAEIFARRLVSENPQEDEYKYLLAESLMKGDEIDEAESLMHSIAPETGGGYGRAHLWIANRLTNRSLDLNKLEASLDDPADGNEVLPEDLEREALRHYRFALEAMPEQVEPRFQLGRMYELIAQRKPEGSQDQLINLIKADQNYRFGSTQTFDVLEGGSAVVEDRANYHYKIVSIPSFVRVRMKVAKADSALRSQAIDSIKSGRESNRDSLDIEVLPLAEEKAKVLDLVNRTFPGIRLKTPNDYRWWWSLSSCCVEIEDYERALEILAEAYKAATNNVTRDRVLQYAANVQLVRAQRINNLTERQNYSARLRVLAAAVTSNPRNLRAYQMLVEFIGKPAPLEDENDVPEDYVPIEFEWLIAEGAGSSFSGVIHALAGIHLIAEGDIPQARKYWEIGAKFDPKTPLYINFLLQTASKVKGDREFPRVVDMLAQAIELFSNYPDLYVTRGSYARRQGRIEDAIRDYEAYLEIKPEEVSVLQLVKLCYRQMGDEDAVIEYDKMLDEVLEQKSEIDRTNSRRLMKLLEDNF